MMPGANQTMIKGERSQPRQSSEKQAKKPYKPPKLIEYGSVTSLTAGTGGSNFDSGHDSFTKVGEG
jgi:hypothetical protein